MTFRDGFRHGDRPEGRLNMVKGAILLALVILVAATALDLAVFVARVRKAQWEAEGMAMAAATELSRGGDETSARGAATNWLLRNKIDLLKGECCRFGDLRPLMAPDSAPDTVTATSRARHGTFFLHLLGLPEEMSVERTATAQVVSAAGGALCPLAVLGDPFDVTAGDGTYLGVAPGRVYAVDLRNAPQRPGDFLPLDFDGTGIDGYYQEIAAGCEAGVENVRSAGDVNSVLASGNEVSRSTLQALTEHYSHEVADGVADYLSLDWCDVDFVTDGDGPGIGHTTGFSPYLQLPRKECVSGPPDGGAGRIVLVPVVSGAGPDGSVVVLGVAAMYVVGWDRGSNTGADGGRVYGMFLERALTGDELTGDDDNPLAPLHVVLLD
jgi:hypothetical protein